MVEGIDMTARSIPCERCVGSGEIGLRNNFHPSYVGPGPVPDDARGVFAARCDECRGTGVRPS